MSTPSTTPIYAKRMARILTLITCLFFGSFILLATYFAETDKVLPLLASYALGAVTIIYPFYNILPQLWHANKPMLTLSAAGITLQNGILLSGRTSLATKCYQ